VTGRSLVSAGFHSRLRYTFTVRRRAGPPAPSAQAARAAREESIDRAAALGVDRAARANRSPTEVLVGVGTRRLSLLAFHPRSLTVRAGTSVLFRWAGKNEIHTVTLGPTPFVDDLQRTLIGPPSMLLVDSRGNGFLGSGPPPTPATAPRRTRSP
jgi:plastocyanin